MVTYVECLCELEKLCKNNCVCFCALSCSGSAQEHTLQPLLLRANLIKEAASSVPSAICLPVPQLDQNPLRCTPHPSVLTTMPIPTSPPAFLPSALPPGCSCGMTASASSRHTEMSLRDSPTLATATRALWGLLHHSVCVTGSWWTGGIGESGWREASAC